MKCKTLGVAALLVLCSVAPAFAGSVYVPVATDYVVDGVRYQTQVWVTNSDSSLRQYTTHFIPSDSDGTDRIPNWGVTSSLQAGDSVLLSTVTGPGQMGMLEISGAPQIVAGARLVSTKDGVTGMGTEMPVISSKNMFAANAVAHNQGWVRSGDLRSDFGVVNLGSQEATCSIAVFRNDGSQILTTAVITVKPLSQRHFSDALDILGVAAISAVRSEMRCDQPFYTYLLTYDRVTGDVFISEPNHTIGESTLVAPGGPSPSPGPQPSTCESQTPGVLCFSKSGTFFSPTPGNEYRRETWVVPPGNYSKLRLQVEIVHGGWTPPVSGLHLAFWLARDGRHRNLYGFSGFKGPGNNSILFRHGIGMVAGAKPKFTRPFQAVPGQTYFIDYTYSTSPRTLSLKLLDANHDLILEIVDRPNVNVIEIPPGETITADFSHVLGANPIEPPSYGWQYRNLKMELFE